MKRKITAGDVGSTLALIGAVLLLVVSVLGMLASFQHTVEVDKKYSQCIVDHPATPDRSEWCKAWSHLN